MQKSENKITIRISKHKNAINENKPSNKVENKGGYGLKFIYILQLRELSSILKSSYM